MFAQLCAKRNKKGFTLAELLIVVAIVAVLVAIALPVFTAQLNKARHAVDAANIRSAYGQIAADFLTADETSRKQSEASDVLTAAKGIGTISEDATITISGTKLTVESYSKKTEFTVDSAVVKSSTTSKSS